MSSLLLLNQSVGSHQNSALRTAASEIRSVTEFSEERNFHSHGKRQTDGDCRLPAPKAFPRDEIYIISLSDSSRIVGTKLCNSLKALIEQVNR